MGFLGKLGSAVSGAVGAIPGGGGVIGGAVKGALQPSASGPAMSSAAGGLGKAAGSAASASPFKTSMRKRVGGARKTVSDRSLGS